MPSEHLWTRRETLALGLAMLPAASWPATSVADLGQDALLAYARRIGTDPAARRLGEAAAGDQSAPFLEARLRARIPGARDEQGWREGLLEAGRADLAQGALTDVAGYRLTQVEADFLGLAARLQPARPSVPRTEVTYTR